MVVSRILFSFGKTSDNSYLIIRRIDRKREKNQNKNVGTRTRT